MIKSTLTALAVVALTALANAQISPAFPSGINAFSFDAANNANYTNAFGPSGTNIFFDSDANVPSVIQTWNTGPVNLTAAFGSNPFLAVGGSVKTIFIGETAGWTDDFGFTPSSSPSSHIALVTDIRSNNIPVSGGNIVSGWDTLVNYSAGTTADFFVNSGGDLTQGGLFYAFGTPNQFAGTDTSSHVKWTMQSVNTTFFNGTSFVTAPVNTLLVGFEDTRQGVSFYDGDSNDVVVAFQFLPTQPVPEPSTYGLIGAAALLGLVGYRRFKRKVSVLV